MKAERDEQPRQPKRKGGSGNGKKRRVWWKIALYWGAVVSVVGLLVLFVGGLYLAHDMPSISELQMQKADPSMVILARDGSTIATFGDVHGDWLTFDEFPETLLTALIAIEDRRFFTHPGFDLKGLLRAAVRNASAGRIVEGGSTITQQLAKNLFLSSERTHRRKIQEIMIAFWLETQMSKKEILTLYLNRMYFGARSYGVDAAAHTYFGHGARDLSLSEAAMLVGLLKAPSALAPNRNYSGALDRSYEVLAAMADEDIVPQSAIDKARANPPKIIRSAASTDSRYFADWVVDSLPKDVRNRGVPVIVETTLDPVAQRIAERALRQSLNSDGIPGNISQGAVAVMTVDGSVIAMVGGKSYLESQFNRATQAKRQPGSAFKLFVYLAALDAGIDPDSTMRDTPIILGNWSPSNYKDTFEGEVTLRRAFEQSINTVAVKLSERVDRRRVIAIAKRLGIKSELKSHPSIALGTSEVTLIELTAAYGVVANGGYAVVPSPVIEARTVQGEILYRRNNEVAERLVSPEANDKMRELLTQVVASGTGRAAQFDGPAAGKTGTTQDFRDAWFVGYSGDYVAGVWLGNDNSKPMTRVSGGTAPAKLWASVMEGLKTGNAFQSIGRPVKRPTPDSLPAEDNDNLFDRLREKLKTLNGE